MKKLLSVFVFLILSVTVAWTNGSSEASNQVVIAEQFGLGYAPLAIIRDQELIEKYYPEAEVEWVQLGSGGAIREAMAAGRVDIGSMGVPPFLIGWGRDFGWRVISGLCYMPLGMQTYRSDVQTLADITPDMKIALPSPGSIQHILLAMAAEKQLGDARAMDNQLVAMAHPDATTALLNRSEIDAHFTSPPYIFQQLKAEGVHQVVDAQEDSFGGPFTFLVSVATSEFRERNPELFEAVFAAYEEAIDYLNENPREAAPVLAEVLGISEQEVYEQLTWPGVSFATHPTGMLKFLSFMNEQDYVDRNTADVADLLWSTLDSSMAN